MDYSVDFEEKVLPHIHNAKACIDRANYYLNNSGSAISELNEMDAGFVRLKLIDNKCPDMIYRIHVLTEQILDSMSEFEASIEPLHNTRLFYNIYGLCRDIISRWNEIEYLLKCLKDVPVIECSLSFEDPQVIKYIDNFMELEKLPHTVDATRSMLDDISYRLYEARYDHEKGLDRPSLFRFK